MFCTRPNLVLKSLRALQDTGTSAKQWLADFAKTLDLLDRFDEEYPPVKLAILDTGIDAEHPWMRTHWKHRSDKPHFYDFTTSADSRQTVPNDETGHGTHMAGLILQTAPDVDLYVFRVFTDRKFDSSRDSNAMERVARGTSRYLQTAFFTILTIH
jgi:subtilisin family serine protease